MRPCDLPMQQDTATCRLSWSSYMVHTLPPWCSHTDGSRHNSASNCEFGLCWGIVHQIWPSPTWTLALPAPSRSTTCKRKKKYQDYETHTLQCFLVPPQLTDFGTSPQWNSKRENSARSRASAKFTTHRYSCTASSLVDWVVGRSFIHKVTWCFRLWFRCCRWCCIYLYLF